MRYALVYRTVIASGDPWLGVYKTMQRTGDCHSFPTPQAKPPTSALREHGASHNSAEPMLRTWVISESFHWAHGATHLPEQLFKLVIQADFALCGLVSEGKNMGSPNVPYWHVGFQLQTFKAQDAGNFKLFTFRPTALKTLAESPQERQLCCLRPQGRLRHGTSAGPWARKRESEQKLKRERKHFVWGYQPFKISGACSGSSLLVNGLSPRLDWQASAFPTSPRLHCTGAHLPLCSSPSPWWRAGTGPVVPWGTGGCSFLVKLSRWPCL